MEHMVPHRLNTLWFSLLQKPHPKLSLLNWKVIGRCDRIALNAVTVPGRFNVYTFGGDRHMNGILIVVNKQCI